jgi:hypothetical protein
MILTIILLMLALGVLTWRQARTLNQKKLKKELVTYLALMVLAATLGSLLLAQVPLPSPSEPLRLVFKPVGDLIFPHGERR